MKQQFVFAAFLFVFASCGKTDKPSPKTETSKTFAGRYSGVERKYVRSNMDENPTYDTTYNKEYLITQVNDSIVELVNSGITSKFHIGSKSNAGYDLFFRDYMIAEDNAMLHFSNDTLYYTTHLGGGVGGLSPYTNTSFAGKKVEQ